MKKVLILFVLGLLAAPMVGCENKDRDRDDNDGLRIKVDTD